jgi:nicotinic acid mononucleotide adenylyltransferase
MKALMTFGRFQPPTKAHLDIFKSMLFLGEELNVTPFVFISPSHDNKSNPLSLEFRARFLYKRFPEIQFIAIPEIKNPFDAVCSLGKSGVEKIYFLCGSDRIVKYRHFKDYLNHPDLTKTIPGVKELEFIEIGRDPIDSISSTKARNAAKNKDFRAFLDIIPVCDLEDGIELYTRVKSGLSGTINITK